MPKYKLTEEERRKQQARASAPPSKAATTSGASQKVDVKKPSYEAYDPTKYDDYNKALEEKLNAQNQKPVYQGTYDQQIQDAFNNIVNRPAFQANINGDAMYNAAKDRYTQLGQMAMKDTMGQATGLTGGYASSYAQNAGQQAYDASLDKLMDIIPTVQAAQRQQYNEEGAQLRDQYNMLQNLGQQEYGRHQDDLSDWYRNQGLLQDAVDSAYNQHLNQWQQEQQLADKEYDREQDAWRKEQAMKDREQAIRDREYNRLIEMIRQGYTPDKSELDAAGMSDKEYQFRLQQYQQSIAPPPVPSGGGGNRNRGGGGSTYDKILAQAKADIDAGRNISDINSSIIQNMGIIGDKNTIRKLITETSKYADKTGKLDRYNKHER